MNKLGIFLLVASMATAGAISPALAQHGDQGGMMGKSGQGHAMDEEGKAEGQGMMGCPMMGGKGHGKGRGMMNSRPMMEARLAYTKADLEITDAQTEAWDAYADAVRAGQAAMKDVHADMMKAMKEGTAQERIDARIKAMGTKLDNLKALKPGIEGLYAELTESQKKKADKLLSGDGCPMM